VRARERERDRKNGKEGGGEKIERDTEKEGKVWKGGGRVGGDRKLCA